MSAGTVLMNAEEIDRALARMAHQILEVAGEPNDLALVGIRNRGVPLARRLAQRIAHAQDVEPAVGTLDINLYRDDLSIVAAHPVVRRTEIPFPIEEKRIVLVDDVLYTGRTIRAAMDALIDLGRPRVIRLAVLIDRGGRELPIHADFVGRTFMVGPEQLVDVRLSESDGGPDEVLLSTIEREAPPPPPRSHARPAGPAPRPVNAKPDRAAPRRRAPKGKPAPKPRAPQGKRAPGKTRRRRPRR
ncbi:MAG: bifunctional pyr operon transcriptional regulator/uracil phosphoribosyltransferase PyrR [Acidobacteria bacterium]|nr:bifunctional pyr operon transcriptional regulator/uracil phosphoribosyltransferase PyrR [Acidobacteriota bacterium]